MQDKNAKKYNFSKDLNEIGERIKRARKESGLSQAALAEKIGKDFRCLSRLETGKEKSVKLMVLVDLSRILDVSIDYLLTGKNFSNEGSLDQRFLKLLSGKSPEEKEAALAMLTAFFESLKLLKK